MAGRPGVQSLSVPRFSVTSAELPPGRKASAQGSAKVATASTRNGRSRPWAKAPSRPPQPASRRRARKAKRGIGEPPGPAIYRGHRYGSTSSARLERIDIQRRGARSLGEDRGGRFVPGAIKQRLRSLRGQGSESERRSGTTQSVIPAKAGIPLPPAGSGQKKNGNPAFAGMTQAGGRGAPDFGGNGPRGAIPAARPPSSGACRAPAVFLVSQCQRAGVPDLFYGNTDRTTTARLQEEIWYFQQLNR